jgi:hypothetical protein
MKTTFFLENELEEEDIEKIKNFQRSDINLFNLIKDWFLQQSEFPRIDHKLTRRFAKETNKSAEEVNNTILSIYWLNRILTEYKDDSMEDFIEDIKILNPEIIEDEAIFKDRLNSVLNISKVYSKFFKSEKAKSAGAPMLKSSSTNVVLKPVIEEKFDFDKLDIKDYKPQIIKYEPCVLIELSDSNDKTLSFQMDSLSFERFLNNLIALQIELNAVKDDRN